MSSPYDFIQCERSPDTISVSIHNIHFHFTFKHDNKIVEKKSSQFVNLKCSQNFKIKSIFQLTGSATERRNDGKF